MVVWCGVVWDVMLKNKIDLIKNVHELAASEPTTPRPTHLENFLEKLTT